MKKIYILLYSILIINTSLFANCSTFNPDTDLLTTALGLTKHYDVPLKYDAPYCDLTTSNNVQIHYSGSTKSWHWKRTYYYQKNATCPTVGDIIQNGVCVTPVCEPIAGSDALPNVQQADCNDNLNLVVDGMGTRYAELVWQACDSTCYGVPTSAYSCDDLMPSYKKQCSSNENLSFFCVETNGIGVVDETRTGCVPKVNPCDTLYQKVLNSCNLDTSSVDGYPECTHNGMMVTNDTIKCVFDVNRSYPVQPDDCSFRFNEVYNTTTHKCDCEQGFRREDNYFGCTTPVDENATAKQVAEKKKNDLHQAKEKAQAKFDSNTSNNQTPLDLNASDNQASTDKTQNDTLAGIRGDLNKTNDGLNGMSDKLDKLNNLDTLVNEGNASNGLLGDIIGQLNPEELVGKAIDTASYNLDLDHAFDLTQGYIDTVSTDFTNMQAQIDSGFSASPMSKGSSPDFSASFHGTTMSFDLCSAFSIFYPVFYFMFSIFFIIIGLRIFFYGFMIRM